MSMDWTWCSISISLELCTISPSSPPLFVMGYINYSYLVSLDPGKLDWNTPGSLTELQRPRTTRQLHYFPVVRRCRLRWQPGQFMVRKLCRPCHAGLTMSSSFWFAAPLVDWFTPMAVQSCPLSDSASMVHHTNHTGWGHLSLVFFLFTYCVRPDSVVVVGSH